MKDIDPEILIAALAGEATEEQERLLAEWRAADPDHDREYKRLARLWEASGELDAFAGGAPAPSVGAIVEIAESRSTSREAPVAARGSARQQRASGSWSGWRLPALAASLVVGLGLGVLLSEWNREEAFGPKALVTGVNEVATIALEDETVVRLAPSSRLEFSRERNGKAREVSLRGRAYFAVSERPDEPFRVRLPQGDVQVLGTRFDVQERGEDVQVAVVEGEVRMAARGNEVSVGARQVARTTSDGALAVEEMKDVYEVIDWLGRFLVFNSTPMDQVADEFKRRFGIRIEVADSALLDRTVTGWFSDQTPQEMIAGICRAVDARCTLRDGTVRMELSSSSRTRPGDGSAVVGAP